MTPRVQLARALHAAAQAGRCESELAALLADAGESAGEEGACRDAEAFGYELVKLASAVRRERRNRLRRRAEPTP